MQVSALQSVSPGQHDSTSLRWRAVSILGDFCDLHAPWASGYREMILTPVNSLFKLL